jgi:hypothetical protein
MQFFDSAGRLFSEFERKPDERKQRLEFSRQHRRSCRPGNGLRRENGSRGS